MDFSHSNNTTKNHNKDLKESVAYFINEFKRIKEKEKENKINTISINEFFRYVNKNDSNS